jgi:Domain of Unknown Function (DUF748)
MKIVRRLAIVAAVLVALCVIVRLVLDPIAAHETRKALAGLDGYRAGFDDVHISLFPPAYEISRLSVREAKNDDKSDDKSEPLVYVDGVRAAIVWHELLHRRLVAAVRIDHPKIAIIQVAPPKPSKKAPPPDLSTQLSQALPFRLARLEVLDGEVLFRDATAELHPEVWLHHLDLAAENITTRDELAGGRPARVTAHGVLGHSGEVKIFVSADPLASPLAFAGRLSVTRFHVAELYAFLEPKTKLQTPKGTIDVFAEFVSKKGALTGGVKAVLANVEVRPVSDDLWDRLEAWLGDKAVEVLSDRVPGRNAIATTIPIRGALTTPDVQLWPTVLGVVRNAFVAGLASGFSNLPVPTAPAPEGKLAQVKEALSKNAGPPKAQPKKTGEAAPQSKPAEAPATLKGH